MDETLSFTFHSDPGHGWLEVPRALLAHLGILKNISRYSYENGSNVYLEEDCDAPRFVEAFIKKNGYTPNMPDKYNADSPIRNYANLCLTIQERLG